MSTEITKFFGNRNHNQTKSVEGLKAFGQTRFGDGRAMLKLTKSGDWVFGSDKELLKPGTELYVDPHSLASGYVAWHKGNVEDEVMKPVSEGPVDANSLKEVQAKKGWEPQSSIDLLLMDDKPIQIIYKTSSYGGLKEMTALAGELAIGLAENPDRCYAVIQLNVDSYEHSEYGTVYTPELNVVRWTDAGGNEMKERRKLV